MHLNEYQMLAAKTRLETANETYALFNLAAEVGEVMSLVAKQVRDNKLSEEELKDSMKKELGDVLWHICAIADDLNLTLDDIAITNILKLQSRQARNTLQGNGDDR